MSKKYYNFLLLILYSISLNILAVDDIVLNKILHSTKKISDKKILQELKERTERGNAIAKKLHVDFNTDIGRKKVLEYMQEHNIQNP